MPPQMASLKLIAPPNFWLKFLPSAYVKGHAPGYAPGYAPARAPLVPRLCPRPYPGYANAHAPARPLRFFTFGF